MATGSYKPKLKKTKTYSGKFVLRLSPTLHEQLMACAEAQEKSLNGVCVEALQAALAGQPLEPTGKQRDRAFGQVIDELLTWNLPIVGVVLFGSVARGEEREGSDIDLLIVLADHIELTRALYTQWDRSFKDSSFSPQFVILPKSPSDAGSLWFENAIEGIILWEKDFQVSRFLAKIRNGILSGEIARAMVHGHTYWMKHAK